MGVELLHFEVVELPPRLATLPRLEGENARDILLLHEPLDDPALGEFLQRIMRAAQVDLAKDTHHGAIEQTTSLSFTQVNRNVRFQHMLVFGFEPQDFGLQFNWAHYIPMRFMGKTLLFCDSLHLLMEERAHNGSARSGPLWKALQQIFPKV